MLVFQANHEVRLAGQQFAPGEHEIEAPSAELVKHAGSAHAAGSIVVSVGLDDSHVQSQTDAEKAYAAAQGEWVEGTYGPDGRAVPGRWSGPWHEGNALQHRLQTAQAELEAAQVAFRMEGDEQRMLDAQANLAAVESEIRGMSEEAA